MITEGREILDQDVGFPVPDTKPGTQLLNTYLWKKGSVEVVY